MTRFRIPCLSLCLLALTAALPGQDWPNWRGPNHDGTQTAKGLPVDFSTSKHVLWKTPLPGPGASTPIVVGQKVFLSSVDTKKSRLVAMCIDRGTGKVLWRREASTGFDTGKIRNGSRSNFASPSAVADSEHVIFFFGNGDLIAFSHDGALKWMRNIQKEYGRFSFQWTFSASPTLWEGRLFLPILQRDHAVGRRGGGDGAPEKRSFQSFILAINPSDGATWFAGRIGIGMDLDAAAKGHLPDMGWSPWSPYCDHAQSNKNCPAAAAVSWAAGSVDI